MGGGHLTFEDRCHIKAQRASGKTLDEICKSLKVNKSTISRELRRNRGKKGYRPKQAEGKAQERWRAAWKRRKLTTKLRQFIAAKLREDWSPEQIAGRLKQKGRRHVSHERIYQLVGEDKAEGGDLWRHLRWSAKRRRKRYGIRDRRGEIPHRRSIEKRKRKANKRRQVGHLERDLIIGKKQKGALLVLSGLDRQG